MRKKAPPRPSLIRIGGDGVNAAVVAAMTEGKPDVRAELLGVLAARNAKETLPSVLAGAGDPEPSVRLACAGSPAVSGRREGHGSRGEALKRPRTARNAERRELTLMTICSRGREKCVPALDRRHGGCRRAGAERHCC